MRATIYQRRALPKYHFIRYIWDTLVTSLLCCCCKSLNCYRRSRDLKTKQKLISDKLGQETDIVYVLRQLRIQRFMATAMLRRNQTDLIPYSAEYTLELNANRMDAENNNIRKFKFIDEQVQTVPKLLKGFETGTDVYDRMLLFLLTGKDEYKGCVQNWQDSDEAEIEKVFTYDTDNKILASHHNFMKYLQSMPQDMDASMMDEKSVQKILLLPNGEKYKMADESLLTGDIDYKNFFNQRA